MCYLCQESQKVMHDYENQGKLIKYYYLLDVLCDVVCVFERRTMSLVNCLHTSIESIVSGWFTMIMDGFFRNHRLCLTSIHRPESIVTKSIVSRSYDVSVLHRL